MPDPDDKPSEEPLETYELAQEDEPPSVGAAPASPAPAINPSYLGLADKSHAEPDACPQATPPEARENPQASAASAAPTAASSASSSPASSPAPTTLLATEEPKVVDPAHAAARREDERIRAAHQLDLKDRRKRKTRRIAAAILIGSAAILWLISRWA